MGKVSFIPDEHLLGYLDGTLSASEKEQVAQALISEPKVKDRLEELSYIHHQLAMVQVEEPSRNFTQRVMERLDQYPLRTGFLTQNGILLLTGVFIAVGLATFLLVQGVFDTTTTIDLNQMGLQKNYIHQELPSIPFNGKVVVNIIILVNIALAFLVLDRAVFKPWFERRRNMFT